MRGASKTRRPFWCGSRVWDQRRRAMFTPPEGFVDCQRRYTDCRAECVKCLTGAKAPSNFTPIYSHLPALKTEEENDVIKSTLQDIIRYVRRSNTFLNAELICADRLCVVGHETGDGCRFSRSVVQARLPFTQISLLIHRISGLTLHGSRPQFESRICATAEVKPTPLSL